MRRRLTRAGGLALGIALLLLASSAHAVIMRLTPLREALAESEFITIARVDRLAPEKPATVLLVTEDLKGKFPYRRLPVNLTGDKEAQKDGHSAKLLKRLAPELPLVLFASQRGKRVTVFGYTNGTWFQMIGVKDDRPDSLVLAFTHGEPFLRRTFTGTTAELRQIIVDVLAGKRQPPEPNEKEPPGFGPELKTDKQTRRQGDKETTSLSPCHLVTLSPCHPTCFAVIPTLGIGGPLAILALLFPSLFGGVLLLFRRWLMFFTVFSLVSTVYLLHWWFAGQLLDSWWGTEVALWAVMTLITLVGVLWAWRRQVQALTGTMALAEAPPRTELVILSLLSLSCLGLVLFYGLNPPGVFDTMWDLVLVFSLGIWAGTLYRFGGALLGSAQGQRAGLPTEGVMLWTTLLGFTAFALARPGQIVVPGAVNTVVEDRPLARLATDKTWSATFLDKGNGLIVSSPRVVGNRIYLAVAHKKGFETFGAVYCLDWPGRKVQWTFDNDGDMKQVFSSPCVADGRLFIGEGFHDDTGCKLYCLDAATGTRQWEFQTSSQTESSPCVAGGKVFFGAGNDGVYALDAATGKKLWQFPAEPAKGSLLRIGAGPTVVGDRLFIGSGVDRNQPENPGDKAVFCLNAETGALVWKVPTDLPCWGAPAVADDVVYVGLGNGDVFQDATRPAGALVCLDAATGLKRWRFDVPNGILNRPALDRHRVYFGCRDGFCYCLNRRDGHLRWKQSLGSPVIASLVVDDDSGRGRAATVFAIGVAGIVRCIDAQTGKVHWTYSDLQDRAAHLSSSPALVTSPTAGGDRRRLYFGAALNGLTTPALYCLADVLPE
jgi:outer membrane protein assembly factor BamB